MNKKKILIGLGVAFVALLVLVLVLPGSETDTGAPIAPTTRTLHGTLTLDSGFTPSGSSDKGGKNCLGKGGYDDIQEGAQVTVRDETDAIIATGRLLQGKLTATGYLGDCQFEFTVLDIPEAGFYTIEVSHRGGLTHSAEELDESNWRVAFTLGD